VGISIIYLIYSHRIFYLQCITPYYNLIFIVLILLTFSNSLRKSFIIHLCISLNSFFLWEHFMMFILYQIKYFLYSFQLLTVIINLGNDFYLVLNCHHQSLYHFIKHLLLVSCSLRDHGALSSSSFHKGFCFLFLFLYFSL
jgi:hypothetical protein